MKCPIDGTALVIAERSGVEIDYCPQCRGVWLDRGELDKIIDRSAAQTPPPPPPPSQPQARGYEDRGYDPGYSGKKKKRGGFLEDLFDF
ncbi:zf-TFIIB domain-containing protein [Thetidibacter halocola]|uniref:Zf-TFIIB domain-containing protein n=1 Tax=Thetidibacter halocola TaxID=2827239 RepID=A0A8J8BA65_9RHOB|nr:zf-TFIIB domain-containing protein [Thetidibacter halocola]MBS0126225.1 zf-TFIIB domain-containing protein [Thetidibacter halocola]